MTAWMLWAIVVPLIVIAASFFILAIGLLVALGRTVSILRDIEDKLHALNPLCRVVHRLGDVIDQRVEDWSEKRHSKGLDIAELIMWGVAFIKKLRNK